MENFSTTQASNLTAVVGVLVLILNYFKINIGSDELMALVGASITLASIVVNFVNRYKEGDLTVSGFRK